MKEISLVVRLPEVILAFKESRKIPFQPTSIHNPHHIPVKPLTCSPFFWLKVRMLELNHKAVIGADISNMLFSGFLVVLDDLLAPGRKVILPRPVPFRFRLPPGITLPFPPMRPMVKSLSATFGNDITTTATA